MHQGDQYSMTWMFERPALEYASRRGLLVTLTSEPTTTGCGLFCFIRSRDPPLREARSEVVQLRCNWIERLRASPLPRTVLGRKPGAVRAQLHRNCATSLRDSRCTGQTVTVLLPFRSDDLFAHSMLLRGLYFQPSSRCLLSVKIKGNKAVTGPILWG